MLKKFLDCFSCKNRNKYSVLCQSCTNNKIACQDKISCSNCKKYEKCNLKQKLAFDKKGCIK